MKCANLLALACSLALAGTTARAATRDIYPDPAEAKADLAAAMKTAANAHKRVIVDFGGNWCGDCQVLDIYFHNAQNRPLLESNFVLVHINIGRMDENLDIAAKYETPVADGVPALAVLNPDGSLVFSQKQGEFKTSYRIGPEDLVNFL